MSDLIETAAKLDRYYIPTRYPNGLPDITPNDALFRDDAETAIKLSRTVVDRVTRITSPQSDACSTGLSLLSPPF